MRTAIIGLTSMAVGCLLFIPASATGIFGTFLLSLFVLCSIGVCSFRALGLILASVANTQQEANILIQSLYMPMLFLSGATIPAGVRR